MIRQHTMTLCRDPLVAHQAPIRYHQMPIKCLHRGATACRRDNDMMLAQLKLIASTSAPIEEGSHIRREYALAIPPEWGHLMDNQGLTEAHTARRVSSLLDSRIAHLIGLTTALDIKTRTAF